MVDVEDRSGSLDVEAAQSFFTAWDKLSSDRQSDVRWCEWRHFFERWESRHLPEQPAKNSSDFNCRELEEFAAGFPAPYQHYCRSGTRVNVWRTSGLGTDELRNSLVLSWMLDRFGDHGHGSAILELLIEWANNQRRQTAISVSSAQESPYWTRTESLPLGDTESRVDIEIESDAFLIFIEVKIRAGETGNQLERYAELARRKAGASRPWLLFFLTPNGRKPDAASLQEQVIPISWKHVADILHSHAGSDARNTVSGSVVRQFAEHIMGFVPR
jgi:hypothetical protein